MWFGEERHRRKGPQLSLSQSDQSRLGISAPLSGNTPASNYCFFLFRAVGGNVDHLMGILESAHIVLIRARFFPYSYAPIKKTRHKGQRNANAQHLK